MIRFALIGCGPHAEKCHVPALLRYIGEHPGQLALSGACDVRLERAEDFCRRFGFTAAYSDPAAMLETQRPDAVACIVPPALVPEVSIPLLERGVPAVVEKPLGMTRDDARRLARVAAETGTPHLVSVNRRFAPAINRAIEWAKAHGPLRYVRCAMLRDRRTEPDFIAGTGIHTVDALRHIAGDVVGFSQQVLRGGELTSDWRLIDLGFAGGARGRLDILTTTGEHAEDYELFGENYRVELRTRLPMDAPTTVRCWQDDRLVLEEHSPAEEHPMIPRGDYAELTEFLTAIQQGRHPRPTIADVLPSMELCFNLWEQPASG